MPRTILTLATVAAFLAGISLGGPRLADPELATLLRFMAAIKAAMTIGAFALVAWRLASPSRTTLAAAAIVAVALMAAGSGLIWSLSHIALGAVLFHIGLLALLIAAWRDGLPRQFGRAARPQRWATVTATSFLRRNGSVHGGS